MSTWMSGTGSMTIAEVVDDLMVGGLPVRFTAYDGSATGPDGALWFAEFGTDQIGRITTAGIITEFQLTLGTAPSEIALGPDGAL